MLPSVLGTRSGAKYAYALPSMLGLGGRLYVASVTLPRARVPGAGTLLSPFGPGCKAHIKVMVLFFWGLQ